MKLPQISSLEELQLQKQQLRKKRLELEEQLEGNFSAVKEQMTPGNLLKSAWKSVTGKDSNVPAGSLNGIVALGSEFLFRRIIRGKSAAPVYSLGFIAARYALRYAMKNKKQIYSTLSGVMKSFTSNKKAGKPSFDQSTARDDYYF